jgi:hypothetical protein
MDNLDLEGKSLPGGENIIEGIAHRPDRPGGTVEVKESIFQVGPVDNNRGRIQVEWVTTFVPDLDRIVIGCNLYTQGRNLLRRGLGEDGKAGNGYPDRHDGDQEDCTNCVCYTLVPKDHNQVTIPPIPLTDVV